MDTSDLSESDEIKTDEERSEEEEEKVALLNCLLRRPSVDLNIASANLC